MKKSLLQRGKRWRRLYLYLVLAVVFISAGAYLYHTAVNKPLYKEAFLFGTLIRVTAYGPGARAALALQWSDHFRTTHPRAHAPDEETDDEAPTG